MKKLTLLILPLLALLLFLPKKQDGPPSPDNIEMYSNFEFNFLIIYEKNDSTFQQKMQTILDQDYDNFEVYLLIDQSNYDVINPILTYAKKHNQAHRLNITHKNEELPTDIAISDTIAQLKDESIVILLDGSCLLHKKDTLSILNSLYKEPKGYRSIYPNFISLPSYKKNANPVDFSKSSFKSLYVKDFLEEITNSETSHFIDLPLYMKTR